MHDQMVNNLFVASTSRNKMPPKNLKARGRLRHSLTMRLLPIMLPCQVFFLVLSRIVQVFDSAIVILDIMWRTVTLFAAIILVSEDIYEKLPRPELSHSIDVTTLLDRYPPV